MTETRKSKPLVTVEQDGGTTRVVLAGTAGDAAALCQSIADSLRRVQQAGGCRCIVVTGDYALGEERECAGVSAAPLAEAVALLRTTFVPTIAAPIGDAAGVGTGLLLAADLRIASAAASVVLAPGDGVSALEVGVTWELVRMLGRARAFELLYTGRPIGAAECAALGILSHVVAEGSPADEAARLAAGFAARSQEALAAVKRSVIRAEEVDADESLGFDVLLAESLEETGASGTG